MEVCGARDIHPQPTRRSGYTYCFTPKHHGRGSQSDSRWLPESELPRDEEFAVFELADFHDISDLHGNLYGLRLGQGETEGEILELGTRGERIARFWAEDQPRHWHGHPLWPIDARRATNRSSQKYRPSPDIFDRMVLAGLVTKAQARRLKASKH
jgi:hypothetical protein